MTTIGEVELGRTDDPGRPGWQRNGDRIELVARRCMTCGKTAMTAATYCDSCHENRFEAKAIGSEGRLYSFSEIHVAPRQFPTPYVVGYVDIGDVRVFAQIEGTADSLETGKTVEAIVGPIRREDDGTVVESYKFRMKEASHG